MDSLDGSKSMSYPASSPRAGTSRARIVKVAQSIEGISGAVEKRSLMGGLYDGDG